jgi:hypothetical protein
MCAPFQSGLKAGIGSEGGYRGFAPRPGFEFRAIGNSPLQKLNGKCRFVLDSHEHLWYVARKVRYKFDG